MEDLPKYKPRIDIEEHLREHWEKLEREKLKPGSKIGQYTLEEEIYESSMSNVFKARDRTNEIVAVKVVKRDNINDIQTERFKREARVLSQLQHPNIVKLRDFNIINGNPFYVMDYIRGKDLDDLVEEEGPLEPKRAVAIIITIAEALEEMHRRDIYHRDLKPANIMIEKEKPILIDLGIVKIKYSQAALTTVGTVLGTIEFVPPEQLFGADFDKRGDIYSLSASLYTIVCGRPPLEKRKEEIYTIFFSRVKTEIPPEAIEINPEIPYKLNNILKRGINKNPNERPQNCQELIAELEEINL